MTRADDIARGLRDGRAIIADAVDKVPPKTGGEAMEHDGERYDAETPPSRWSMGSSLYAMEKRRRSAST